MHLQNKVPSVTSNMSWKIPLILFLLFVSSHSNNSTVPGIFRGDHQQRNQHKMALSWRLHAILSPIGICFNGVILYMFVNERKTLIKPINVMIW